MARFPSLPLFVDAYLADTGHLTDAEHGRYLLLLMTMWRSPDCRLPDDDEWLAKHFHRSVEEVRRDLRPIIAEFMMRTHGGWVIQHRLLREWSWVRQKGQQGRRAAKSRWNKEKGTSERMPPAHADAYADGYAPIPIKEERKNSTESSCFLTDVEQGSVASAPLGGALARPALPVIEKPSKASKPSRNGAQPIGAHQPGPTPDGRWYAPLDSPEQRAWEEHRGSSLRDRDGGWIYPTQWPNGAHP